MRLQLTFFVFFLASLSSTRAADQQTRSQALAAQCLKVLAAQKEHLEKALKEVNTAFSQIDRREAEAAKAGEITPAFFDSLKPGDEIGFLDGARFTVEAVQSFTPGFKTLSISNHNLKDLTVAPNELELIVPSYSGDNIAFKVLGGTVTKNPRESLRFMHQKMEWIHEKLPFRDYIKIDPEGQYALAKRIPNFENRLMTFRRFASDKDLTHETRQFLADKLEVFLQKALNIHVTLSLESALVFDPTDLQWKLQMLGPVGATRVGANFVGDVRSALKYMNEVGDREFFWQFIETLSELQFIVEDLGRQKHQKKRP